MSRNKNEHRLRKELEWERQQEDERTRWLERRNYLYDVPEEAKDAYLTMEDQLGESQAKSILEFMQAMKEVK